MNVRAEDARERTESAAEGTRRISGHLSAIASAVEKATGVKAVILNPNLAMAQQAASPQGLGMALDTPLAPAQVDLSIVSRVPWDTQRLEAYETLFSPRSPRVVQALKHYEFNPELFRIL